MGNDQPPAGSGGRVKKEKKKFRTGLLAGKGLITISYLFMESSTHGSAKAPA
jgi:hypothetical protein